MLRCDVSILGLACKHARVGTIEHTALHGVSFMLNFAHIRTYYRDISNQQRERTHV